MKVAIQTLRPIHFKILLEYPEHVGEFYEKVFGWEMARWEGAEQDHWPLATGPAYAPGVNGALMGIHFPQSVIITFEVPDLQPAIERVKTAGGKPVNRPNEVRGVGVHACCADPAGVLFGMTQPTME